MLMQLDLMAGMMPTAAPTPAELTYSYAYLIGLVLPDLSVHLYYSFALLYLHRSEGLHNVMRYDEPHDMPEDGW